MESYIGEIRIMPYLGRAVAGWLPCNGQLLPVTDPYAPLFALIGTTYGGDGTTNFAVPNLQGVAPVGAGAGPGLSARTRGASWGRETVVLTSGQMPAHSHAFNNALSDPTDKNRTQAPVQTGTNDAVASMPTYLSKRSAATGTATFAAPDPAKKAPMSSDMILPAIGYAQPGAVAPHNNVQPWFAFYYYICIDGVYPAPTWRPPGIPA